MRILVTGAGLVGCHVAKELSDRGHDVVLYDLRPDATYVSEVAPAADVEVGDVCDLARMTALLELHQTEVVFHSAFLMGGVLDDDPMQGLRVNVDGTMVVGEAVRLVGARRLLFAGTFGIYDWGRATGPIDEDFPVLGAHFYTSSKIAAERLLAAFAARYGFEHATLRFAQVYGHGHYAGADLAGPSMERVVTDALEGGQVQIDQWYLAVNDYVYVEDLAAGVANACELPLPHDLYNLGSGSVRGPHDIAEAIRSVVPGTEVEVLPEPDDPIWNHFFPLDISRARAELRYEPRFGLEDGFRAMVESARAR